MVEEIKGATLVPEDNGGKEDIIPTPGIKKEVETPLVVEKTFTQKEIDAMITDRVKRAKESSAKDLLKEYGFDSKENLADYLNKSETELSNYKFVDACNENKIRADKFEDIKVQLKGQGLEATPENIKAVAESHPEWARGQRTPALKATPIGSTVKGAGKSIGQRYEDGKDYFPSLKKQKIGG